MYRRRKGPKTLISGPPISNRPKCRYKSSTRRKILADLLTFDPHCAYCGIELNSDNSTLDHIIPRSKGGSNHPNNLVLACVPCNNDKGDQIVKKYVTPVTDKVI